MNDIDFGFLLKITPYKEKDALLTCLLEQKGKFNLLLKGVYKPNSKQLAQISQTSLYQFRFHDIPHKLNTLIEATRVKAYLNLASNPSSSMMLQILSALFIQFEGESYFELYQKVCEALNQGYDPKLVLSSTLGALCQKLGCEPLVDETVDTHSQKVNGFSIKDGGFVQYPKDKLLSTNQLKQLRILFKSNLSHLSSLSQHLKTIDVLSIMIDYFEYHSGCQLYGKELI